MWAIAFAPRTGWRPGEDCLRVACSGELTSLSNRWKALLSGASETSCECRGVAGDFVTASRWRKSGRKRTWRDVISFLASSGDLDATHPVRTRHYRRRGGVTENLSRLGRLVRE